ncbi:acid protease [Diaporthe helianthi]|uniref:Acid protease n=1 Tax=Diaporthe helianthi TaxID=158607 RepID=A0A2P5IBZ8_DIAHE|nr:acid protease [Diaporthe helianthi]
MKACAEPALLALLLAVTASAKVVRIPVARNSPGATVSRRHHPRLTPRASFTESLVNNITGGGYYASVSVGTPGQDIDMILDTGSSDAFIVAAGADLCQSPRLQLIYQTQCGQTFDPSRSSTFDVVVPDGFQIQYLDGSTASGDYITDHFEIGDTVIESLQMGLANQTASGTGVLGIGYTANEAAETLYPNLVDQMVAQDFIPTKAYSLYLNDYQSSTGSILFGGVDTEKFIGGLTVIPVLRDAQTQDFTSFTVGMTAISYAFPNGTTGDASLQGGSLDAILDSGTTLSYFPDSVATPLFEALGAFTYSSLGSVGLTMVECSLATSGLELTFRFNDSVSIVVPADEVVIDAFGPIEGNIPPEIPLEQPCLFGIQNSGDSLPSEGARQIDFALLGDTFLRSAYVVYDLDNNEIAMAQANLNSTDTNVQELTESSDLSSFEGVEQQQQSSGTSGGGSSGTDSSSSAGSSGTLSQDFGRCEFGLECGYGQRGRGGDCDDDEHQRDLLFDCGLGAVRPPFTFGQCQQDRAQQ